MQSGKSNSLGKYWFNAVTDTNYRPSQVSQSLLIMTLHYIYMCAFHVPSKLWWVTGTVTFCSVLLFAARTISTQTVFIRLHKEPDCVWLLECGEAWTGWGNWHSDTEESKSSIPATEIMSEVRILYTIRTKLVIKINFCQFSYLQVAYLNSIKCCL